MTMATDDASRAAAAEIPSLGEATRVWAKNTPGPEVMRMAAAAINRIGASVPPDVPEPSASHQAISLARSSAATAVDARRPFRTSPISSYTAWTAVKRSPKRASLSLARAIACGSPASFA